MCTHLRCQAIPPLLLATQEKPRDFFELLSHCTQCHEVRPGPGTSSRHGSLESGLKSVLSKTVFKCLRRTRSYLLPCAKVDTGHTSDAVAGSLKTALLGLDCTRLLCMQHAFNCNLD